VRLDREEVLPGARLTVRNDVERGRRLGARSPRLSGLTLHELLAEQGLWANQARSVLAEVLEGALIDVEDNHRLSRVGTAVLMSALVRAGDVDGVDRANPRAGDPHLFARNHEGAVIGHGSNLV